MSLNSKQYQGKRILVVEDDKISRTLFREMFKNCTCELAYANSATEALEYFEHNPLPDLVLMDIRLPDISGIELTKELKIRYPELVIVAQTAFAYQDLEEECMRAGMFAFITKPIQQSKLFALLNRLGW